MSDTPLRASGFGLVTGEVCRRLASLGHDMLVLGWWSTMAVRHSGFDVKPCPVCPEAAAVTIAKYVAEFRPDYLITLGDVPWLSFVADKEVQHVLSSANVRWFIYYPVDGVLPDGSLPAQWVQVLSKADAAIAMSKFGLVASARSGISATLIPHGCDTEMFRPPTNKEDAKRRLGYDGKFVILSDARNHRRKLIPRALDIVRQLDIAPGKLVFHLHTNVETQEDAESYRYNVRADIDLLGLDFVTGLRDGPSPSSLTMLDLAALYSAADVHLLVSFGEGFGLPTLQAASSGVVPVAPANSASTELVDGHGFAISCDSSSTDEFGIVREFIDRRHAISALRNLYDDPKLLRARSEAARNFALDYSWDTAVQRWDALLREGGSMPPRGCWFNHARLIKPGDPKKLGARPSGHSSSVLPIPRIGIPARLELEQEPEFAVTAPLVLAEWSSVVQLLPLERLFPGVRIRGITLPSALADKDLCKSLEGATLVVDPENRLRPKLDLICALRSVNFLGKSDLWPSTSGERLLFQARRLLTDYAFSEARLSAARRRAQNVIGAHETIRPLDDKLFAGMD